MTGRKKSKFLRGASALRLAFGLGVVTLLAQPLQAMAEEKLAPEYLHGLWSLDGAEKCTQGGGEYFLFEKDGTFKQGRLDRVETAGFWRLDGDEIVFHMVGSFSLFSEKDEEREGRFQYFRMRSLPINLSKDAFSGVASFGEGKLEKFDVARCPQG